MSITLTIEIQPNDDTMMTIDVVYSSETETSKTEIFRVRARKVDGTAFDNNDLLRLEMESDWSWIEKMPEDADKTLKKIIDNHKKWLDGEGGCRADLHGADLHGANLARADLHWADLSEANLHGADLSEANLRGADLHGADLHGADLHWADLSVANLHGADLSVADLYKADLRDADLGGADLRGANLAAAALCGANLRDADLYNANLDFSSWPLWCGSLTAKIDAGLAAQLMYHAVRACQSVTDDKVVSAVCRAPEVVALANRFARADECGPIKGKEGGAE